VILEPAPISETLAVAPPPKATSLNSTISITLWKLPPSTISKEPILFNDVTSAGTIFAGPSGIFAEVDVKAPIGSKFILATWVLDATTRTSFAGPIFDAVVYEFTTWQIEVFTFIPGLSAASTPIWLLPKTWLYLNDICALFKPVPPIAALEIHKSANVCEEFEEVLAPITVPIIVNTFGVLIPFASTSTTE